MGKYSISYLLKDIDCDDKTKEEIIDDYLFALKQQLIKKDKKGGVFLNSWITDEGYNNAPMPKLKVITKLSKWSKYECMEHNGIKYTE